MDLRFFFLPCFHGSRASRLGHKRKGKPRSITCRTDRANEVNKRYLLTVRFLREYQTSALKNSIEIVIFPVQTYISSTRHSINKFKKLLWILNSLESYSKIEGNITLNENQSVYFSRFKNVRSIHFSYGCKGIVSFHSIIFESVSTCCFVVILVRCIKLFQKRFS